MESWSINGKKWSNVFSLVIILLSFFATSITAVNQTVHAATDWGDQFITHAELQDGNGNPQTEFGLYDTMKANWDFTIPAGTAIKSGDTMTVPIPEVLRLQSTVNFDIKDTAGKVVGKAVADPTTGKVNITLTDYAESAAPNGITGDFNVWVLWNRSKVNQNTNVPIDWGTSGQTEVKINDKGNGNKPDDSETLYKFGSVDANDPTLIHWTIRTNFAKQDIQNAVYKDTVGANQKLVEGSIGGYHVASWNPDWSPVVGDAIPADQIQLVDDTHFNINFGELKDTVYINYDTRATDGGASSTYQNSAALDGNDTEIRQVDAYTPENGGSGGAGTTLSVTGKKTWVDDENKANTRPASIKIDLLKNGESADSKTVTADDNWSYSFTGLAKYDENNKENVYTVKEEPVANYTTSQDGYNFTNTLEGKTEVSGEKTWSDDSDKAGKRPTSIVVNLLADGKQVDSKTVTATDNWKYDFTDLDKYKDGKEITYTVSEEAVPGYTTKVDGNNITNTYDTPTPETTELKGEKTWIDNENKANTRPASIVVNLLADGEKVDSKTVTAENNWSYDFKDLAKAKDGKDIAYTVSEETVPGYTTKVDGNNITNTYETPAPETTEIKGQKYWADGGNQANTRPASIVVNLLADGKQVDSKTVTSKSNWSYDFKDLAKTKDGKDIVYTVSEDPVSGYTSEVDGNNITNTLVVEPEVTELKGQKTWVDNENKANTRPESIVVNLYADYTNKIASKTVTAKDNWSYDFKDLAKTTKEGREITYTVSEEKVPGYKTTYNGNDITNTYETPAPETTELKGEKTWVDNENKANTRPESIVVNLLADGKQVDSKTVTAKDNWSYDFKNLAKAKDGKNITYTVSEEAVPGYTSKVDGNNITNTYETPAPETTELKGQKTWADDNNKAGKRPESIVVNLLADGKQVDSKTVTEKDNWSYDFKDLAKVKDGKAIVYTVTENAVADYTSKVDGANITNTYAPGKTSMTVTKHWNDKDNQDKLRPESIQVQLYANGKAQGEPVVLNEKGNWTYAWKDLATSDDQSKAIKYTVKETAVPTGYVATVTGEETGNVIITNTHTPNTPPETPKPKTPEPKTPEPKTPGTETPKPKTPETPNVPTTTVPKVEVPTITVPGTSTKGTSTTPGISSYPATGSVTPGASSTGSYPATGTTPAASTAPTQSGKSYPQTGEKNSSWLTIAGIILLALLGGVWYWYKKESVKS